MKKLLVSGLAVFMMSWLSIPTAEAVPPFARKYKTSCQTCHVAYPKLNAFGEAFRRNGFYFPKGGDYEATQEEPVSLGAKANKRRFPNAVWPGSIPGTAPIGFAVAADFRSGEQDEIKGDIQVPKIVKIIMAGTMGEKISGWADLHLVEDGAAGSPGRIYIQFNDLLKPIVPEVEAHIRIGQFDPDLVLANSHRILSINPIATQAYNSATGLDAGHAHGGSVFSMDSLQRGLELRGTALGRVIFSGGIVNGNGSGVPGHTGSFDDNNSKDIYGRIAYKLGGLRADGSGQSSSKVTIFGASVDNTLQVGGFAYRGKALVEVEHEEEHGEEMEMGEEEEEEESSVVNGFRRTGVDILARYGRLEVRGAYMTAKDDDPHGEGEALNAESFSVQGQVLIFPWMVAMGRWERVLFEHELDDVTRFIPNITILLRANIKIALEGILTPDDVKNEVGLMRIGYAF